MPAKLQVTTAADLEKDIFKNKNTLRRPLPRKCSQCGRKYFRRNMMEQWTGRNDGRRYGWHKDVAKVCLSCMSEAESRRIIGIADVQFGRLSTVGRGGG